MLLNDVQANRSVLVKAADYRHLLAHIADLKQEHFLVLTLDSGHRLIKCHTVFIGTLTGVLSHPREVFAVAVEDRAAALVLAHNHPSGDTTPSSADIGTTQSLIAAGIIFGVPVIDHIIVARTRHFSFRERGMI